MDTTTPNIVGKTLDQAKSAVAAKELKYVVYGSGDKVVQQVPEAGQTIPNGGTVAIFMDQASTSTKKTVPKLTGLTLSAANAAATNAGIQISVTGAALTGGSAISNTQSIPEGTEVAPGTVVTVGFVEFQQIE